MLMMPLASTFQLLKYYTRVYKDSITVDSKNIKAMHDRERPNLVTNIWSFVRLADYYKWFIEGIFLIIVTKSV